MKAQLAQINKYNKTTTIRMTQDGETLTLTAYGLYTHSVTLKGNGQNFDVTIDISAWKTIQDYSTYTMENDELVFGETFKTTVPYMPVNPAEEVEEIYLGTIDGDTIKRIAPFLSTDPTRMQMKQIYVKDNLLSATDGFIAAQFEIDQVKQPFYIQPTFQPTADYYYITNNKPGYDAYDLPPITIKAVYKLKGFEYSLSWHPERGNYPDFDAIDHKEKVKGIIFTPEVIETIKALKAVKPKEYTDFMVTFKPDGTAELENLTFSHNLNIEKEISFQPIYLQKVVNAIGEDEFTMFAPTNRSPFIWRHNLDRVFLMPMHK